MVLIVPKCIRLTEDVPEIFRGNFIPAGSVGEILLQEWVQGRNVWFVEFVIGKNKLYADVYPDQANLFNQGEK